VSDGGSAGVPGPVPPAAPAAPAPTPTPDAATSAALETADAVLGEGEPAEGSETGESAEGEVQAGDYHLAAIPGLVAEGDEVSANVVGIVESFAAEMGVEPDALRSAASELQDAFQRGAFTDEAGFVEHAHRIGERLGAERWEIDELVTLVREAVGLEGERRDLVVDRAFGEALHDASHPKHAEARRRWYVAWGR